MPEELELAQTFIKKFEQLKESKGAEIKLVDIRLLIEDLTQKSDKSLYEKILAVAVKIHHLKDDFAHIDTDKVADEGLTSANSKLEDVIKSTEKATNTILDATTEIQSALEGADDETLKAVQEQITKIFEACNFQDLTSQHITHVVKTLSDVEVLIKAIIKILPEDFKKSVKEGLAETSLEESLMQGPQLAGDAPTQDDIDKLFAEC
jgi:chemotaxis protein CheZ